MFAEAPIVAHVLSPLKYVVAEGVPVAERLALKLPVVVILPPIKLINVVAVVSILVTVPPPGTPV